MDSVSDIKPRYFNSEIDIELILWVLSKNDIAKVHAIENMEITKCYNWYYNLRVKELNELIGSYEQLKKAKEE